MIVGCGDLTILLLGLGFHCFLFRKRKTASQPWQAIAQRFCSMRICMDNKDIIFETDGEENEEELNIDLSKFNQAVIWGTDWTTETMARQLEKGNIDLNPSFQRRDAWSEQEKSRLIESLMLGFPVPPIILAENKQKKNSYLVIDGKQRLLSIRRFYSNVSEKEFKEKNLKEKDAFKQLKLKGLDILKDFNGKTYSQMQVENAEYVKFDGNFDYAVMAQSPNYTPASADFILDIFREYIEEI